MVMLGVHVGAREDDGDPVAEAAASGADGVQVFLADPQGWKTPKAHPHAEAMRAAGLTVFVHAPYIVNVATTNNRIRIPSRKLLAAHAKAAAETGASGLIVHGGHVLAKDDPQVGFDNWRKVFERQAAEGGFPLPVLIENTAGGVDVVTIGQYLQPSPRHATIDRWVHPDEFRWFREQGEALGFGSVFSGPLVRSSYRADEQRHAAATGRGAVAY